MQAQWFNCGEGRFVNLLNVETVEFVFESESSPDMTAVLRMRSGATCQITIPCVASELRDELWEFTDGPLDDTVSIREKAEPEFPGELKRAR